MTVQVRLPISWSYLMMIMLVSLIYFRGPAYITVLSGWFWCYGLVGYHRGQLQLLCVGWKSAEPPAERETRSWDVWT